MKLPLRSKILISIIGILFIISLNFFQKEIKNFFYLISSPIQKILWETGQKTSLFFETIREIKNLKKENEELKLKIQALLAENISLKELRKQNEFLRKALDVGLEKEFKLLLAQVIGKDLVQDSLIINKGSKDGISKNFPVITQEKILVGKIQEVYNNFSKVQLVSNKDISFDGKMSEAEIYGVVKGKGNFKIELDFVPRDKEIKEGDLIVTSAIGGIFPAGILVGEIEKVKKDDIEPFQKAEVKPVFEIKNLDFLFIIQE